MQHRQKNNSRNIRKVLMADIVFTPENPATQIVRPSQILYKFRCPHCGFSQVVESRADIPDKCIECNGIQPERKSTKWLESTAI